MSPVDFFDELWKKKPVNFTQIYTSSHDGSHGLIKKGLERSESSLELILSF